MKVSRQHGRHGVVEIDPHLREIGLLGLAGMRATTRQGRQSARKEAPEGLRRSPGGVEEVHEHRPLGGDDSRLLREFTACRLQGWLSLDIAQTCRKLKQVSAHGMAELTDKEDSITIVDGRDTHRTGVHDDVSNDDSTVRQPHFVACHRPHSAPEMRRARE